MDIIRLYQDNSVDYKTEGHKHCRPGWVNVICPFCIGNPGYHLGYDLSGNYFYCWRCGWHPIVLTISKIMGIREASARVLVRQYGLLISLAPTTKIKAGAKEFQLPSETKTLTDTHRNYLASRGFDPDLLEQIWNLMSTGPVSKLDGIDYKHRIIIPFYWDGQIVSFDSRSSSAVASHEQRYKACPLGREIIPHKQILYGRQDEWRDTGICVEGPTDVWRMGTASFATSGIQYTPQQVRLIAKIFRRVFVMFDNEVQAQKQASKLVADLSFRGVEAALALTTSPDPASMSQDDANHFVKNLMSWATK